MSDCTNENMKKALAEDFPNPIHEAEREEWRNAHESLSEMERAYDDTDTH